MPELDWVPSQTMADNAKRFLPSDGEMDVERDGHQTKRSAEMKVELVSLARQANEGGCGYMSRLKDAWDQKFEELKYINAECLRDTAAIFEKEPEVQAVLLIRERGGESEQDVVEHGSGEVTAGDAKVDGSVRVEANQGNDKLFDKLCVKVDEKLVELRRAQFGKESTVESENRKV